MNTNELTDWLIGEARLSGDGVAIVEELGRRLVEAGVPLWRLRVAQTFVSLYSVGWLDRIVARVDPKDVTNMVLLSLSTYEAKGPSR